MAASKKTRKPATRTSEGQVTESSGNVFIDLGFDKAEARVMAMRAEVMIQIESRLKSRGWTQAEAAQHLGITQPRISKLKKVAWHEFSLDMLITLAGRAGLKAELRLK